MNISLEKFPTGSLEPDKINKLFLLIISSFVMAEVKDQVNVFKPEEVKALNDRIKLLKEQTGIDFEVITLAEENEKILMPDNEVKKKEIVRISW